MKWNVTTAIWTQVQKVSFFSKWDTTIRNMWYGFNVSHSFNETWLLDLRSSIQVCSLLRGSKVHYNSNWTELICNELLMTHYWLAMQGLRTSVPRVPGLSYISLVTSSWPESGDRGPALIMAARVTWYRGNVNSPKFNIATIQILTQCKIWIGSRVFIGKGLGTDSLHLAIFAILCSAVAVMFRGLKSALKVLKLDNFDWLCLTLSNVWMEANESSSIAPSSAYLKLFPSEKLKIVTKCKWPPSPNQPSAQH